jgi:peptide chain release factor subunit 1
MAEALDKTKKLYELKRQLRYLSGLKGNGTELISVYIPPGSPIHEMGGKLREEAGQASNIKSKSTRNNVVDALEKIIQHLKFYRTTPVNGLAIFCGNISDNPAKVTIELFAMEPPEPVTVSMYRCDSRFFLEPLERLLGAKDSYGIVVLDGREATLASLKGTNVQILHRLNSTAHAKIRKGGQSARRFERLIEESIELYYKRVGEYMDKYFVTGIKGVIIGGPGPTKENFVKFKPFNYQIKILGVVDTGYTDEYGIRETMAKAGDIIAEQEAVKEKVLLDRFTKEVVSGRGLAIYGEADVRRVILSKQAESAVLSEGLKYKRVEGTCVSCGKKWGFTVKADIEGDKFLYEKKCDCPAVGKLQKSEEIDLLDDLIALADTVNIPVHIVSTDTAEGTQFLQTFYGVGAFLRYR